MTGSAATVTHETSTSGVTTSVTSSLNTASATATVSSATSANSTAINPVSITTIARTNATATHDTSASTSSTGVTSSLNTAAVTGTVPSVTSTTSGATSSSTNPVSITEGISTASEAITSGTSTLSTAAVTGTVPSVTSTTSGATISSTNPVSITEGISTASEAITSGTSTLSTDAVTGTVPSVTSTTAGATVAISTTTVTGTVPMSSSESSISGSTSSVTGVTITGTIGTVTLVTSSTDSLINSTTITETTTSMNTTSITPTNSDSTGSADTSSHTGTEATLTVESSTLTGALNTTGSVSTSGTITDQSSISTTLITITETIPSVTNATANSTIPTSTVTVTEAATTLTGTFHTDQSSTLSATASLTNTTSSTGIVPTMTSESLTLVVTADTTSSSNATMSSGISVTTVSSNTTVHISTAAIVTDGASTTGSSINLTVTTQIPTIEISTISGTNTSVPETSTSSIGTDTTMSSSTAAPITTSTTQLSTTTTTITTTTSSSTTTVTTTTTTITVTAITQNCIWSNWIPLTNCTPSCGIAYRQLSRSCIDSISGQSCNTNDCSSGNATQNELCTTSPPCETLTVTLLPNTRDPNLRISSYVLPDAMYFFEETYRRIWITNKGYITFDTPYYGQTMTRSTFPQLSNQAVAAPFWTNLTYDYTNSNITINWFNSINASQSEINAYYPIIQQTISEACPTQSCSLNLAASRAVRIEWKNLTYQLPDNNQFINVTFAAYLINTYDTSSSSYPILRSYLAFDYSNLIQNLGSLRPFVGYRGRYSLLQILNDPSYNQNARFLRQSSHKSFYIGGRFLTQCEVSYLQETAFNALNPSENLNDIVNNPRFPCPCTLGQARADRRFSRLSSETFYESSQNVVCYGPMILNWVRWKSSFKNLRPQTCCYKQNNGGLLTYGSFAGSVLSNALNIFQLFPWQRRISFHDQCCSPVFFRGPSVDNPCRLYYQVHPASTCNGYQATEIVTNVGDPHIDTIDNGRYTCHIQGLFVFAQTTANANQTALYNLNNVNVSDTNLIYPEDLFYIYVRSASISPALPYVERMQGYASIFSTFIIGAGNYTFTISNVNGKFGFTASNNLENVSLTNTLANNLNYDSINLTNLNDRYMYRVKQISISISNTTVPQLTLALWSGLSIQCQIMVDNLECIVSLPQKYRTHIEGLAGNFNGLYSDDLINRQTNQTVSILPSDNQTAVVNDMDILNACLSWRVSSDTTANITKPIMPSTLVDWYYNSASSILTSLNSRLNQSQVNQTCSSSIECVQDYIVRVNPIASGATALLLNSYREARTLLAEKPPIINVSSTVQIPLSYNVTDRNYSLPISISGASNTIVSISTNGTVNASTFQGSSINIPIPNNTYTYVDVSLTIVYGTNSTLINYLKIIACLCIDSLYCDYAETTILSENYELASCNCPDQYDGIFCQLSYDGCNSSSACRINWNNGTGCVPLSPTDQMAQNHSYICNGTCSKGYSSQNQYTCEDENECQNNPLQCGNGTCINLIGSFTCNCTDGYRFENDTCIPINKCAEPNIDGSFTSFCNESQECEYVNGSFTCACSPVFNSTGTCAYNSSLCVNDTCTSSTDNNTISCLHGTIKQNNSCIPWCQSSCPNFCERVNGFYQCNCMKQPGFQHSDDGKQCLPCGNLNYGYGCNETCQCGFGTCNANATSINESCTCDSGYERPLCNKRIDICDPSTGNAILICMPGYEMNSTTGNCTDVNECANDQDHCNVDVSSCVNTIGSYRCDCLTGYRSINGSCVDINECEENSSTCLVYDNTYCANIQGSYECRCNYNYSLGGDYTQQFENARNSNQTCLPINYSAYCQNQCQAPASCSATTGRCECPSSSYTLVEYALNQTLETCQCPGHPFIYFNGSSCINATGETWFLLDFQFKSRTRVISINTPGSVAVQNDITNILLDMNITCNGSCIKLFNTEDLTPPDLQLMVTLDVILNVTERIILVNRLLNDSVTYNDSYILSMIRIIMNPSTNILINISTVQPACQECVYMDAGVCWTNRSSCTCFAGHEGYLCRLASSTPSLSSQSPETNWTVIVAVVSAIAGLLFIISIAMCVFYCVKKRQPSETEMKTPVQRPQFVLPRVHIPTMGTGSRALNAWDGFSLDNTYDEQYVDASDSFPSSSSTTYNTTYHTNGQHPEADFGIFDELENRIPMSKGHIPRPQMVNILGTLNSLPSQERFDEPSGDENTISDFRDIDDIELVTDMLDDMTKDDDVDDEFVEALNPNLSIPRLALHPETQPSGWFPFFRNS
ncbi:hypothetical protein I4U23_002606 [Adineta vaga]|nr:hypothetical protein I4U23_002606 [Adineta vaga]